MFQVDINNLHVNMISLRVDIMCLACRGQKYATISRTLIGSYTDNSDWNAEVRAKVNSVVFIPYHLSRVSYLFNMNKTVPLTLLKILATFRIMSEVCDLILIKQVSKICF